MMNAFIPVAMKSLLKVWLCLLSVIVYNIPCTANVAPLVPLAAISELTMLMIRLQRLTCMLASYDIAQLLSASVKEVHQCSISFSTEWGHAAEGFPARLCTLSQV